MPGRVPQQFGQIPHPRHARSRTRNADTATRQLAHHTTGIAHRVASPSPPAGHGTQCIAPTGHKKRTQNLTQTRDVEPELTLGRVRFPSRSPATPTMATVPRPLALPLTPHHPDAAPEGKRHVPHHDLPRSRPPTQNQPTPAQPVTAPRPHNKRSVLPH